MSVEPVYSGGEKEFKQDCAVSLADYAPAPTLRRVYQFFQARRWLLVAFSYFAVQALVAAFVPLLFNVQFDDMDLGLGASPPSLEHWFGTDDLGRDLFVRVFMGARVSLAVGVISTLVSLIIGVIYGSLAGYIGGRVDHLMMRAVEVVYALPFIFFVIILMVIFGRNIYMMFLALGAVQWLTMARIVRGQVVSLKNLDYILAARITGLSNLAILFRHLLPNMVGPIVVYVTLTVPVVILEEAFLSFLGLGVQEPMSSWGTLIADGMSAAETSPWMLWFPSASLMMTLLALNALGEGLRQVLDPKGCGRL